MKSHRSQALMTLLAVPLVAAIGCQSQPDDEGMQGQPSETEMSALQEAIENANQAAAEARQAAEAARAGGGGRMGGVTVYSPTLGPNQQSSGMAFPTGDPLTSPILLHEVTPVSANLGEPYNAEYHVTNTTSGVLQNVTLRVTDLRNMEVRNAQPEPSTTAEGFLWALGDLDGGETRVIRFQAISRELGQAWNCITVAYNNELCASVPIVAPDLMVRKTATPEVLLCDPITLTYVVTNPGTGLVTDVQVVDNLPQGLALEDGSRQVRIPVGSIEPGGSREFTVVARATSAGEFTSAAAAASRTLETESQATTTIVRQPVLAVASDCIEQQYIVRPAVFRFDIGNVGDGIARGAVATSPIPQNVEILSVSEGGAVEGNNIVWRLGDLRPNDNRTVSYVIRSAQPQAVSGMVSVNAECAEVVQDDCAIELVGIPAILLEVVDLTDPVEVGTETTYLIIVTNQGTKPGTNVRILATLPASQAYVSSSGPTQASVQGQQVAFAPYRRLGVGESIEFRVTIRALEEADARFLVELRSDEMISEEPVLETESTFLYR